VVPQLEELAADRDAGVARRARSLMERWEIKTAPVSPAQEPLGLWHPVPDVWQVPRFERGPDTPEALTDSLAELFGRPEVSLADLAVERFLAVANAVARSDLGTACAALTGVRNLTRTAGLYWVPTFLSEVGTAFRVGRVEYHPAWADRTCDLLPARESAVFQRLGQVPCLLSEPSTVDLATDPADLADRLEEYLAAGVSASEPDFLLALARSGAADAAVLGRLEGLAVPVVAPTGEPTGLIGGPAAAEYLRDRLTEPALVPGARGMSGFWETAPFSGTSLTADPVNGADRVSTGPRQTVKQQLAQRAGKGSIGYTRMTVPPDFDEFPRWGDAAYLRIRWNEHEGVALGLRLRQAARRAAPLTPGAAMNMLAIQRYVKPRAAPDAALAVAEAWERGLLRPGVPDLAYLDWERQPKDVAALVAVLRDLALTGMLALVWPLLDRLVLTSARAPRLLAGTLNALEAIDEFLPEVRVGVAAGTAPAEALDLPGARTLMARGGSSRAVAVAREVVAKLPPPRPAAPLADPAAQAGQPEAGKGSHPPTPTPDGRRSSRGAASPTERPFEELWPEGAGGLPAIDDGVNVTAQWLDSRGWWQPLGLVLSFPGSGRRRYLVVPHLFEWELDRQGSIDGRPVPPDCDNLNEVGWSDKVWLYWDADRGEASTRTEPLPVAVDAREPPENPMPCPPLSNSLVAVALASGALPGRDGEDGERLVKSLATQGKIGSQAVRAAARMLLRSSPLDPGRLARPLERTPALLPYFWPWLTESVAFAAEKEGPAPRWLLPILGTAEFHAPRLIEAARRGLIPAESAAWPGLAQIAARRGKSLTLAKARNLSQVLGVDPV
jgi:hypothetical protein